MNSFQLQNADQVPNPRRETPRTGNAFLHIIFFAIKQQQI